MKKYFPVLVVLLLAGLACQLSGASPAPAPAVTQVFITQVVGAPETDDILLEVGGRSSRDVSSELLPYLTQLGWVELGIEESGIIVGAPEGLGLAENGLAYHISFNTGGPRYLALVGVEMYFVPEKIGTPYDEVLLFSALNRNYPLLSVYQDMNGNRQTTFRGVYSFNSKLNVNDFINYLNVYTGSVDQLLLENPFFSNQ